MAGNAHGCSSRISEHPPVFQLTSLGACVRLKELNACALNTPDCKEGWDYLKNKLTLRSRCAFLILASYLPALPSPSHDSRPFVIYKDPQASSHTVLFEPLGVTELIIPKLEQCIQTLDADASLSSPLIAKPAHSAKELLRSFTALFTVF
ncbi:unnamed protein product [Rangifer tarandus platyrhynchus]|uniref:Uncharacterized protein n=2 Tax=Rangifer tarandus platyrhynchus TaxID=3082113 RepID=A0ABN8Y896_RANTA|nr:unnamed protein product [Rangifer tarandus platyrhynchus]